MSAKNIFLILFLAVSMAKAQETPSAEAVLAKVESFENSFEKATFQFEEEFVLVPTNERERVKGRVYLDRKKSQVRVDYSGAVKAKVWMDERCVCFFDASLKQAVFRSWEDFRGAHFQAFMDIPILQGVSRFKERFDFKVLSSSGASLVEMAAMPKKAAQPYEVRLRFEPDGKPQGLSLLMENYKAHLKISNFVKGAKFKDSIFNKNFPPDTAILNMSKENCHGS